MSPRADRDALRSGGLVEFGGVIGSPSSQKVSTPRRRTMSSSTPRDVMPLPSTLSMPQWNAPRLVTELAGNPLYSLSS